MENSELERMAERIAIRSLSIQNDKRKKEFADKLQVTKTEIVKAFDLATFNDLTSRLGLRPIRQNGRNGKLYYSTKKVLDLTEKWFHT